MLYYVLSQNNTFNLLVIKHMSFHLLKNKWYNKYIKSNEKKWIYVCWLVRDKNF